MEKKRFPANPSLKELTFLNDKKINGDLYAYLQSISQHFLRDTYVLKKDLPTQQQICNTIGIKSPKTLRVHLNYLVQRNYIIDNLDRYTLPEQEDFFLLVPIPTLTYLINNCREHVIKIYLYLGERWQWAQKRNIPYKFTIKEILEHLGLKSKNDSHTYEVINDALLLLSNSGLISYSNFYEGKVPYKCLDNYSFAVQGKNNSQKQVKNNSQ